MAEINQGNISSVATEHSGELEYTAWNNGGLTIANWRAQFEPENLTHSHVYLTADQVRALRGHLSTWEDPLDAA